MKKFPLFITTWLILICPILPPLHAGDFCNIDSSLLFMGELQFQEKKNISAEGEQIYLSPNKVKVRLILLNESSQTITSKITFATTQLHSSTSFNPIYAKENPLDFKVRVNEKEVEPEVEKNMPDVRDFPPLHPVIYSWPQVFPKKEKITIEYSYKPFKGSTEHPFWECLKEDTEYFARSFCIEPPLTKKAWMLKMEAESIYHDLAPGNWWEDPKRDILQTSWKGLVKNFKLIIDKEKPENLISLCIEGIKKISPTQFEVVKKNFTPQQDLNILFIGHQTKK